ncbi:MAG: polyprenol monophosphomannose synthase [Proteobacteria bacterium]|jgi:dolichol-phosphate mannosyltransferase|nr:polyprenol monophosphomannose synthase [Pseudomonadota bacterium]MDE0909176.1 polyprenol monophosphomannose synthase [Myxococcota bacterium]
MTDSPLRTLVILPTYDEKDNVTPLSEEILGLSSRIEILVVDDASPDGTGDVVEELGKRNSRIHLLRRSGKLGLGTAYLAGFQYGLDNGYDLIFTMDADRSHNPKYLPAMLEMLDDMDMVVGSRYVPGGGIDNWQLHRRLLSNFANFYTRAALRVTVHDCTAGFRGYRREVLETVDPFRVKSSGYSFLYEMVWRVTRAGFRIGEVPIVFEPRFAGASKINSSEIYIAAFRVLMIAIFPPKVPKRKDH